MDLTQSCQNLKNNLDPGQAIMAVFPDTMYTFRVTQGEGVKIDNFFSYLTFVTASSWSKYYIYWSEGGGGRRGPDPLEKHKLYGIL